MFYFPLVEKIAEYIKRGGSWVYWVWVLLVGLNGAVFIKAWKEDGFDDAYPLFFFWIFGGLLVAQYEKHREKTSDETSIDKPE